MPRIVLFTESAPSPVCRPIAHENAKCGQFFSCILNETGVYYCQRAMRYFGPEYMPSEAFFKLISLAKFRGILRLKPGFRHRGFESSTLRHFCIQKWRTKPQDFTSLCKAQLLSKAAGFSSHLHPCSSEALLVKSLPAVACEDVRCAHL